MNKKHFKPEKERKRVRVLSETFVKKGEVEYYQDFYENNVSHTQRENVIDFTNVKKGHMSAEYFIKNYNSDLLISEKLLTDALSIPIANPRVSFHNILIIWLYVSFKLKALFIGSLLSTSGMIYLSRVSPAVWLCYYFLFPLFMTALTIETIKESKRMYEFFFQRSIIKEGESAHLDTKSRKSGYFLCFLMFIIFGIYTFISHIYLSEKSKESVLVSLNPLPIMNLILYFIPLIVCSTAYLLNNELKYMENYGPLKNWKKTAKTSNFSFFQSKCQIQNEQTMLNQYQLNIRFYTILSFICPMFKEKGSFLSIQHNRKKQYEKEKNFPVFPNISKKEVPDYMPFIYILFSYFLILFGVILLLTYTFDVFIYFLHLLIIVLLIETIFRGILIFKKNYQDTIYIWKKVEKFGNYNDRLMITIGKELYQSPPITQIRRVDSSRYIPKLYLGEGQSTSLLIEMSDSPNFLAIGYIDKDTISYKENTKKKTVEDIKKRK